MMKTGWSYRTTLGLLLIAAGCSPTPTIKSAQDPLTADAAAQKFGISSYALVDHGATLLDASGQYLGTLFIASPDDESRYLRIDLADGHWYDSQVTRPTANGFVNSYANDDLLESVQTDPALAALFASYHMTFHTTDASKTTPTPGAQLGPSQIDTCDPPPNPSCRAFSCTINYDNTIISYPTACQATSPTNCASVCTSEGLGYGSVVEGPPHCNSQPNNYACECTMTSIKSSNNVSCPRLSCTNALDCDQVERVRTCLDPGSCSNAGSGYLQCTTQLPAAGLTCSAPGSAKTLTVVNNYSNSGTVTSNDGVINCGRTCSGAELVNNVVVLTATPISGLTFTGWSGACTGTSSTCSVTMSAAKAVTATFSCMGHGLICGETVNNCTSQSSYNNCGACCSGFSQGSSNTCVQYPVNGSYAYLTCN